MTIAGQLHQAMLDAGLNITGVVMDKEDDPSTWRVQFAVTSPPPTKADLDAAASVITSFKPVAEVPAPTLDKVIAALIAKGVLSKNDVK